MNGVELLTSWFTPTVLFCLLNVMIATIFITSSLKPPHTNKDELPPPPQLIRVPSFFERVRSFNLSNYQSPQPDPAHHAVPAEEPQEEVHHVIRSKSDSVAKAAPAARVLQKSASEKVSTEKEEAVEDRRRPETARERAAEQDEAVDEKADDFINRFRQQLKLQRLDSILRSRKCSQQGGGEVRG